MTAVVLAALIVKVIDFLRLLAKASTNVSGIVTQLAAWLGGILVVVLASHSSATAGIVLPSTTIPLGALDGAGQVLVGMVVASLGSLIVDVKQGIDNTDSAQKPPLLGPPPG